MNVRVKCQLVSAEGDRVRVRFTCGQGQIADFLVAPDHPLVTNSKVNQEYDLTLTEVPTE